METGKMSLSKREKRLIYIAICFGMLTIMIVLVIIPLSNRLTSSNSEYDELVTKYSQIKIALATEENIRSGYDNALNLFHHMRLTYESETLSSDIGLMLTQLVQRHNLTPISQTISPPEDFIIPSDNDDDEQDNVAVFSSMSVSMAVSGEYFNVKRLVDSIADSSYIRVRSVSISFAEDDTGHIGTDKINIRFEVIMLKETTHEEIEEETEEIADILDL